MMEFKCVLLFTMLAFIVVCTAQRSSRRRRNNRVRVDLSTGRGGRARLGGEWSTGGRNWRVGGGGHIDSSGRWGLGVSASWRFKKRSIATTGKRFEVMTDMDPCHFDIYDISGDGVITLDEMRVIFFEDNAADELFKALDRTTADNHVTKEEFRYMVPRTIANCVTSEV